MKPRNVVIIGSGPAGYTAAIYTSRALLDPLLITGENIGGQLMQTSEIENFPGFKSLRGSELMENFHIQAEQLGTEFLMENVLSITGKKSPFTVKTNEGKEILTKTIIIATGSKALWLNAENEEKLKGWGVSTCATCDGAFYKNKKIVVIGGGDTAMEDANYLTRYSDVQIIHRREGFRASKIMLKKARDNPKISWNLNKIVKRWISEDRFLSGAILEDVKTGEQEEIYCDGAFVAIGHRPMTEFLKNEGESLVDLDQEGYIIYKKDTMTSMEGIFACGDVCVSSKRYKQAITASGEGCKAAMDCEKWLEK